MLAKVRQHLKFQALLAQRAQSMWHNGTETEHALWRHLSGKKLGVAFRRQVPIDRFIVDFLAPSVRLVVEIDGGYHSQRGAADARRDRVLGRLGYRVLRLDAALVARELPVAINSNRALPMIRGLRSPSENIGHLAARSERSIAAVSWVTLRYA